MNSCNSCTHSKMSLEQGLICDITNQKPVNVSECESYEKKVEPSYHMNAMPRQQFNQQENEHGGGAIAVILAWMCYIVSICVFFYGLILFFDITDIPDRFAHDYILMVQMQFNTALSVILGSLLLFAIGVLLHILSRMAAKK